MTRKQGGAKRRAKKHPKRVLTHTENGFEWQTRHDEQEKKPVDEIFERVLSRFGWATNPEGSLEHVGSGNSNKAR
jgi:hypothetical protein